MDSIPTRAAELIRNANRHPCFLGVLGILPNQLRTLLKESGHENREVALLDISRTLFFAGFRVWTKRQQLNSYCWIKSHRKIWKSKLKQQKEEKSTDRTVLHLIVNAWILFISSFAIATCHQNAHQNVRVGQQRIGQRCTKPNPLQRFFTKSLALNCLVQRIIMTL